MSYEHKEGSGALFKNTKKEGKQPDYRGNIMLGGVVYELAGWVKNTGKGPFLSVSGKPEGERGERKPDRAPAFKDDSIPF